MIKKNLKVEKPKELIIGKKVAQKLNKNQQTFNRLVKKLEKLRKESEKNAKVLSEKLDFYGKHIHPLEQDLTKLRIAGVKVFYKFYKNEKRISKRDRDYLLEAIAAQLNSIFAFNKDEPDDEIKEIFELVEGMSLEEAEAEDFDEMKADMEETFGKMGFDIDLDDFHKDLSEAEMMRKMAEMLGNLKEQAEAKEAEQPKRKKTKKQLEKEAREQQIEEAKNKNISTIYKQLARMFHPDLEQDTERKAEKEVLMKELTAAYEKGDLHTLLRMELEWIQKEEDNLDKLSDEKLSIYNQVLKEQVEELEEEMFMTFQHPRYQPLQRYSFSPLGLTFIDLEAEKRNLHLTIKDAEKGVVELNGKNALDEVRTVINIFKKRPKKSLFDLDLEDLFR